MALTIVTNWVPGQVLTASALVGEFNNIYNNPITLISPTTAAINFNLTAHTNLVVTALSATSGSTGQTLTVSTAGTPVWTSTGVFTNFTSFTSGQIPVGTTSGALAPIAIGTTGQVLAVTSSNSTPAWQVIPISGGLTSGTASTGTMFYVSSSGVLTPLAIGTTGQVLTVVSSLPTWSSSGLGAAGGGGGFSSNSATYFDDFLTFTTSSRQGLYAYGLAAGANTPSLLTSVPGGIIVNTVTAGLAGFSLGTSFGAVSFSPSVLSTVFILVKSTIAGIRNLGFVPDPDFLTCGINQAGSTQSILVFQCTGAASTWKALSFSSSGLITTINTTAVGSTSFQRLEFQFTSSGTLATVFTNGVSAGTITSSQLPAVTSSMAFGFGTTEVIANAMYLDAWQIVVTRPVTV